METFFPQNILLYLIFKFQKMNNALKKKNVLAKAIQSQSDATLLDNNNRF